jgi:integral membrane sensor domain MASE1
MPNAFPQFGTYLIAALIVFVLYRRLRRTFGRQPLRTAQMVVRIVLFAVLGALLSPTALRSIGVMLAVWGASRTRFERVGGRLYYVPHTYTGIAVSLLFVGRVAFRVIQAYQLSHVAGTSDSEGPPPGMASYVSSPLTLGLFFVLAGYYLCYYGLVLWKSKHLNADDVSEINSPLGTDGGSAVPVPPP